MVHAVSGRRCRGVYALCMGAMSLAGCGPGADEAGDLSTYLLQSLIVARQTADTLMLEEIFLPDATYDDFASQIQYRGIEEIVGYVTSVHEWGDDVFLNLGTVHSSATSGVGEWFLVAVQSRPILDLITTGTGREVALNGATIIELEGGRISRAADYTDMAPLMLQLGGRIELPDGSVLEGDDPGN